VVTLVTYLDVEWSTDDPGLLQTLREVAALPEGSASRLAAQAELHEWYAGQLRQEIGRLAEPPTKLDQRITN